MEFTALKNSGENVKIRDKISHFIHDFKTWGNGSIASVFDFMAY